MVLRSVEGEDFRLLKRKNTWRDLHYLRFWSYRSLPLREGPGWHPSANVPTSQSESSQCPSPCTEAHCTSGHDSLLASLASSPSALGMACWTNKNSSAGTLQCHSDPCILSKQEGLARTDLSEGSRYNRVCSLPLQPWHPDLEFAGAFGTKKSHPAQLPTEWKNFHSSCNCNNSSDPEFRGGHHPDLVRIGKKYRSYSCHHLQAWRKPLHNPKRLV